MLKRLYIRNFALIQEMDVTFPGDLTVITGETGAGKSIFLEALGLALGKRADSGIVKNKTGKCIIEAEFDISKIDLEWFFAEQELQAENQIILRREISADGKSRSFLNDSVIGLSALKVLSENLLDVHSQHQTLLLSERNFQTNLVDAFAGNQNLLKRYRSSFSALNALNKRIAELQHSEQQSKKELDYVQFLFSELAETEIKSGLLKSLEEEGQLLENAETIRENLYAVAARINEGELQLLSGLSQIRQSLNALIKFGENYKGYYDRVNSVYIELKDLADEVANEANRVSSDREKLESINSKLDKLNRLLKKHAVRSEEELLAIKSQLEEKLHNIGSLASQIEKLNREISTVDKECHKLARELTDSRKKTLPSVETSVKSLLNELSMPNATFEIRLIPAESLSSFGMEQAQIYFNANKGGTLTEIHKVASGGELSRLMLAIKSLLASRKELPSIIFDEIDTGVSGDVADKIGNILSKMARSMQVIAITHLPQMASKGSHHLFVYKKDEEESTASYIRELSKEERVTEIAKMLSTSNPTQSALKNAKELLKAAVV